VKLAVIVLNFRTPDLTLKASQSALDSLRSCADPWVLLIVDNHSADGSEAILRAHVVDRQQNGATGWDRVTVLQSGFNGGFGAGNNHGIRHALETYPELRYVHVLNSDAFPQDGAISTLVDFLDGHEQHAFVGSYIYGTDGEPHVTAFRFPTALSEFEGSVHLGPVTRLLQRFRVPLGIPESSLDVDWTAGASLLMRIEALREIGLFDETFFLYFEETDLCLRARRAGWRTHYLLESSVAHIGSATTGMKSWDQIPSYWYDSRKHYFKKNHGVLYFGLATACHLMGGSLHKLRCWVQQRRSKNPAGGLWALMRHALTRNV
jgi:GT2 family glycosyltransferase